MVIALAVVCAALAAAAIYFAVRFFAVKISLREIGEQTQEKLRECSNAPVAPQSRAREVRRLCTLLTEQTDALIDARRRYEEGDRELRRAVTNVSHDLRTPLTSASGYIGILERSGLDEKQAEFLAVVKGRIEAMKQLTEDLLAYSVILSEEAPAAGEVCVNDVLEDSLTQFFAAFAERGIEPQIDICAERVVRRADRGSLSRMFGNVISNAVRYSGGDFCASLSPEGEAVFENAAPQLDEVSAGKLFDRFFTVENARGSTGLGLSIARALAERAGGSARAEYRQGRLRIVIKL